MNRFQQHISEMLKELSPLHAQAVVLLEQDSYDTATECLTRCQEKAIRAGEWIEASEGEGTKAVAALENYCEVVYQAAFNIKQGIFPENLFRELEDSINAADKEIKTGIRVKKEIVFFPYKASMWDSLESVYYAAAADPDCDVYVVPIPYFDKNADGSFGRMHDESDQYPSDIPVCSWQEYNVEKRMPDAIFIHNPYDNCNRVTSVHPMYYSRELRKYTGMLVYIPYFVLLEKSMADIEWYRHVEEFCVLPGTIYAHKVVLQSETIRQIYIKVFIRECAARGVEVIPEALEGKFCALGSPKLDKLAEMNGMEAVPPQEWLKAIRRPDGSMKKVLLYNTGLAAFLRYREQMLDKMEAVFRIMEERKSDYALLWRPHPLYRNTILSAAPELLERYDKIVGAFQAAGTGIYDDTADPYCAIQISDAYYGDGSSLVPIYKKAGKIVMIQSFC